MTSSDARMGLRERLRRWLGAGPAQAGLLPHPFAAPPPPIAPDRALPYSWVLTNRLALGPMPAGEAHWQQLEQAGLRARFSCCYPVEEGPLPPPAHWLSDGVPLPDHRAQELLEPPRLALALDRAQALLQQGEPVYLHCMAGIERSPLLAVGLIALERRLSLFEALDWVRRCHPVAQPVVEHLQLLEQLLSAGTAAVRAG